MEGVFARLFPMITREYDDEHDEHDDARSKGEVIHSGHFMISSVADQDELDDEVSHDRDSPVHHEEVIRFRQGYDFSEVRKETQNTYQFGHRSTNQITIDASLSRLFECMSLAYRGGKVVSPKWKNFKGMKLSVKDKIRLNNAIWRTWHIQYIMKKKRNRISFVQFATPLDNESDFDSHSKPEAVVMEGKYWKRRIETVVAEYKKWRAFFMEKLQQSDHPGLTWVTNQSSPSTPESFQSSLDAIMRADDSFSDLADRLFSRMSQPFQFPNPREIAQHATNSDMMQPGLLQLQPPIEDFMDPLDTLHDIFSTNRRSPNNGANNNINSLFYAGNNTQSSTVAQHDFPTPMITQQDFQASGMQEVSLEELLQKATARFDAPIMCIPEDVQTMLTRQQETLMQAQRTSNSYRVSDPMLGKTPSNGQMFGPIQQNASMPTTTPMMVSKQQPETTTISQVVKSRRQHNSVPVSYNINQQTKVQTVMPPPQKAPPRRKSFHKIQNSVGTYVQAPIVSTMASQLAPQPTSTTDVPMVLNYTQAAPPINNNQGLVPPGFRVSVQQGVVTPRMSNHTLSPQPIQMQVDKASPQHQMNISTGLPQAAAPDVFVDTGNSRPANGCRNTIGLGRQPPPLIVPVSVQQTISNQYMNSCDQPPPQKKALLVGQQSNPGIVVKQPSSTIPNSQHISARQQTLTQLLTSGKGQTLQPPPNMVRAPTREVQLKQVREQAVNFNTFQNSVLMAAAQMATAPQLKQIQSQNGNSGSAVVSNLATGNEAPNKFFGFIPESSNRDANMDKNQNSKAQWGLSTSTQVTTMDTDKDPPRPRDDFLNQKEEKSYSASSASSSSSPCSDQRSHHFTAEKKRRCNIKSLCDKLQEILPDISNHSNQRVSKAVLLNKSCSYIRQLQSSRQQTALEIQNLKKKIETLNQGISEFQQQLPATGVPVSRHRGNRMKAVFDEWVRDRTLTDWKFFMFSMIIRPWFVSYDNTVSNSSLEEMCRTCLLWLEKHCSMPALRRGVVDSLQELGTTTSILTDPATLQQQAESAVRQKSRQSSTSS